MIYFGLQLIIIFIINQSVKYFFNSLLSKYEKSKNFPKGIPNMMSKPNPKYAVYTDI